MSYVECPVCSQQFYKDIIQRHVDECLEFSESKNSQLFDSEPVKVIKKPKLDSFGLRGFLKVKTDSSPGSDSTQTYGRKKPTKDTIENQLSDSSMYVLTSDDDADASENGKLKLPRNEKSLGKLFGEGSSGLLNNSIKSKSSKPKANAPLAEQMRPDDLSHYVGQKSILAEGSMLRTLIENLEIPSMIFWGPPGCGKTTLAHIIGKECKKSVRSTFVSMSATKVGVGNVKDIVKKALNDKQLFNRSTVLFMDEIHRFNKLQQDTFLSHVENGTIILIGATTENPSFCLNNALLSRCKVFVLEKLSCDDIKNILERAIKSLEIKRVEDDTCLKVKPESHSNSVFIEDKAVDTLVNFCDGDARAALNALQMAIQSLGAYPDQLKNNKNASIMINEKHILEGFQRSHLLYDRAGEEHYNAISALHKSMRGSDKNASLYWLARMLMGGEDPLYIARRLVRFASEDIGVADPSALQHAVTTYQACNFIGLPECKVNLAQCVVYMANAAKSISIYQAYSRAENCISNHQGALPPVPLHLRNAPTKLMKNLGYGKNYKYNPKYDYKVEQKYFPDGMDGTDFFI